MSRPCEGFQVGVLLDTAAIVYVEDFIVLYEVDSEIGVLFSDLSSMYGLNMTGSRSKLWTLFQSRGAVIVFAALRLFGVWCRVPTTAAAAAVTFFLLFFVATAATMTALALKCVSMGCTGSGRWSGYTLLLKSLHPLVGGLPCIRLSIVHRVCTARASPLPISTRFYSQCDPF